MRDQTIAIRVREIRDHATAQGESITDREALDRVLTERGPEFTRDVAIQAMMRIATDKNPPPVPPPTDALFDPSEPIRVPDGENGYLWVPPDVATIGQHEEANDDARQYLRGQLKARERAAVDIEKVLDAAEGDKAAGYRRTLRTISDGTDE